MKRGRPKGATAYPETAVCIKCGVFRPKRRGFCDRCRPRNRGSAAKTASNSAATACPLRPSSSTTAAAAVNVDEWQKGNVVVLKSQQIVGGQSPASDLIAGDKHRSSPSPSSWAGSAHQRVKRRVAQADTSPNQLREKRRRTVSAPPTGTGNGQPHNILPSPVPSERNRNVDVVSAVANTSGPGKDRKLDADAFFPFASSVSTGARQLALLLPRSDGTAVDVVPIQFLASPPASTSSASSSHPSHPSSPSSFSSAHPLMSLANASVLAASRSTASPPLSLATASPSNSWSSPVASPNHMQLSSSSPFSSPSSSFTCGSSAGGNSSFSFAAPSAVEPRQVKDKSTGACGSKAGDLILPSLYSLQLPRPALPSQVFPMQSTSTLQLASMLAPSAPLHFSHN